MESAELLDYSSMKKEEAVTAFVEGMILLYHYPQDILKLHPIMKYGMLHTSVRKKSRHSTMRV